MCPQHGEPPVDDDSLVGGQANHRAGLDNHLVSNTDGVSPRQRLRARPGGLSAPLGLLDTFVHLRTELSGWNGLQGQREEKQDDKEQGRSWGCSLVHGPKQTPVLLQRSPLM